MHTLRIAHVNVIYLSLYMVVYPHPPSSRKKKTLTKSDQIHRPKGPGKAEK